MKKRYILAALAAMTVLAGCGNDTSEKATESTAENTADTSDAAEDSDATSVDEDALEDLDADFSQD